MSDKNNAVTKSSAIKSILPTCDEVVYKATDNYLATINPLNRPLHFVILRELLEETRIELGTLNTARAKGDKIKLPNRLDVWQIARVISYLYHVRRIAGAGLESNTEYDLVAIYQEDGPDEGTYVTNDDVFRKIARQYDLKISTREFAEMMVILGDLSPRVTRCSDPNLIAVNNGIFDYTSKKLLPFSPDYVFTSKSQVNYNPAAVNINIHNPKDNTDWDVESWMHTLSDDDDVVNLLWEILGAIIRPNVPWNKSAWFYSEAGNNGKGTLCELMRQLCGEGSYATIKLSDMGKDFALEPLIHTTAIIVDENDVGTFIDKAANLKALVTGDVVPINRKFKQAIAYRFRGFMVQCLNEMPRVKDKSDSFYRRQLFVPFTKCFTGKERKYIKEDYLKRREVLEYVLKRVLEMNYDNLSEPKACIDVLEEYKEFNDPVREFWMEMKDEFAWEFLPYSVLFDLYQSWYRRNVPTGSICSDKTFFKEIKILADASGEWTYTKKDAVRPSNKMDAPELLIKEYGLRNWMNMRFAGTTDITKLCTLDKDYIRYIKYKGLVRTTPKIRQSEEDDEE